MNRLDYYDIIPAGMEAYLRNYGWHFSKAMCEWAISKMKDRNGAKVKMESKEQVDEKLRSFGLHPEEYDGYDAVFVYHMGKSDYFGSSITDERGLTRYVQDVLGDVDGYDGIAFTRFYADCTAKGEPIIWEDLI